ncbi:hypothetical protein QWY90_01610, partial [Flavobacterium paronense]|uniref:hypothetical protein n=1 Tax=Flavobacterium paronense TaxID=1392775 RepID=UPI0025B5E06B
SLTACNLTVTNSAIVILQSGDTITLNGIVAVDSGSTLTLKNMPLCFKTHRYQYGSNKCGKRY